ncbi:MAG: hypothetical protein HF978_12165 [Desulfobacteraceae bacterium]|nr:hypothetical protein [Desulfobacteraceae bacterium]MBC2756292.1 hypothetical protein [Desulfobacteraceae bacterium]
MNSNCVLELFGISKADQNQDWKQVVAAQKCIFTDTRCFKVRKSQPEISIGTCSVRYGRDSKDVIICPNRLLERKQVFTDCIQLLTLHEPGNEFHIVSEVGVPGGSVDFFLVSAKDGKVIDFVAIEFQTLDTTGTVWPKRQLLLRELGETIDEQEANSTKPFGMNWKMTAKTILVQLHHKIATFEYFSKHLVLVVQDYLLDYMSGEFNFDHLHSPARVGDSMHIHSYALQEKMGLFRLGLNKRLSTDTNGIALCLGLQAEAKIELETIIADLEKKISKNTLLTLG